MPPMPANFQSHMDSGPWIPPQPQLFSQTATAHGSTSAQPFLGYQPGHEHSTAPALLQPHNSLTSSRTPALPDLSRRNHPATSDTSFSDAVAITAHNIRFMPGMPVLAPGATPSQTRNDALQEAAESTSLAALSVRIHNMAFQPGVPVLDREAQFQRLNDTLDEEINELTSQTASNDHNYSQRFSQ